MGQQARTGAEVGDTGGVAVELRGAHGSHRAAAVRPPFVQQVADGEFGAGFRLVLRLAGERRVVQLCPQETGGEQEVRLKGGVEEQFPAPIGASGEEVRRGEVPEGGEGVVVEGVPADAGGLGVVAVAVSRSALPRTTAKVKSRAG